MFFDEDEIVVANAAACSLFGKEAQYTEKAGEMIVISSLSCGKIWYGEVDFSLGKISDLASDLAKKINSPVTITDFNHNKVLTTAAP